MRKFSWIALFGLLAMTWLWLRAAEDAHLQRLRAEAAEAKLRSIYRAAEIYRQKTNTETLLDLSTAASDHADTTH